MNIRKEVQIFVKNMITLKNSTDSTMEEFAKQLGYTAAYLSEIQNLKKVPSIHFMFDVCDFFNVFIWEMFKENLGGKKWKS